MEQIKARKATMQDLDTLLDFEQALIQTERPFDPTIKKGGTFYYDLKYMLSSPDVELVVAEYGGEIIGSGYARIEIAQGYLQHSHYAYLGFMYVDPLWRGKSVNKVIMDYLKQWALSKGLKELRLEVYSDNEAAFNAYTKAGFEPLKLEMRMEL
jgi:GNAT superfamily N-acetyltransferase